MNETRKGYAGFLLSETDRAKLALIFAPKFAKFIGHHVTTAFGVTAAETPNKPFIASVVGYAVGDGVEALVIAINRSTKRADGGTFHITWSLNPDIKPAYSNQLLLNGWERVPPIVINLEPKFFEFGRAIR